MSNCSGSYQISDEAVWDRFDRLPQAVRERLTEANQDWVPSPLTRDWQRGRASASALIATINRWDREDRDEHFARLNRMAETGVTYSARLPAASLRKFAEQAS